MKSNFYEPISDLAELFRLTADSCLFGVHQETIQKMENNIRHANRLLELLKKEQRQLNEDIKAFESKVGDSNIEARYKGDCNHG